MLKIPVFTLTRQNKILKKQFEDAFSRLLDRGIYILGEEVDRFETEFAGFLGIKYAAGVASGTDAISLALLSLGIKTGDEVILPANSYPTVFAIPAAGAVPKLVDIDPASFNIDPGKLEKAITKKTKAIIAVHLYGQPADLNTIVPMAGKYNLPLIEDCAQAHGAEIKIGRKWMKVGTVGDIGCFSFYPSKNLGAFGDGGMVVTKNTDFYEKVKLYRMYGEKSRYKSVLSGRNSRLDELQAAMLRVKLGYLDKWNSRRREIAKLYESRLRQGYGGQVKIQSEASYARHVYHLFVIRSKQRDKLKGYLAENGIGTAIHFPEPIHFQESFKYLGYKRSEFPESEKASAEVLSLPMFPELTDNEIDYIAGKINQFI